MLTYTAPRAYEQREKRDRHYLVHVQLLYRTHGSCSLVVDNVLHIATFAFFALFVRHRFVSCSLTCTLIFPVVFIMGRISSKAHLSVLICVLIADLAALPLLRWQLIRLGSKSELFRQPQIWITILKCALDSALVSLLALDTSKGIDDGKQGLVRIVRYVIATD